MSEIRLLSLWQPWASLIAFGLKRYETRSWQTPYRGKIAIHAAKRPIDSDGIRVWLEAQELAGVVGDPRFHTYLNLPHGAILAIVDLTQCPQMTNLPAVNPPWDQISLNTTCSGLTQLELAVGNWQPGRYAWKLENIRPIAEPIPCRGKQGIPAIRDTAILEEIEQQLAVTDAIEQQLGAIEGDSNV